jgi:Malectin domain/CARDB
MPRRLTAVLLLCSVVAAAAQSISSSKISAHLINNYTVGNSNIISGHPRVLKVLGLDSGFPSGMVQAMRDYKAKAPAGKIVVRIYYNSATRPYTLTNNPTASAGDFWTNVLQKGLSFLAPADRALIDYLEGPNEGDTPTLGYPNTAPGEGLQSSQWFNQFWTNLTPFIVAAGYKPCPGSIAVGNPSGSQSEIQSYLAAFVPALRQALAAGGAWSYHAYTISYSTDEANEYWYSLRYRQFYSYFASAYPDLANMPMILTEGGVDQSGDPSTSGWQARGSAGDYERWLNWFDQELQEDSWILGCTLFENGDPSWSSFELEPISGWMKSYLLGPSLVPAAPSGITATTGNPSVTLSWTNTPLTPTSWSIKRATNSTTGVRGQSYTDLSATNFLTYYYEITAVNAAGESDPSAIIPVSVTPVTFLAVNSGGAAAGSFAADAYFDTGLTYAVGNAITTNGLINPAPVAVYQSQRYGNLIYTFQNLSPVSACKLRLHFAEVYWGATGQRVFNVLVNGALALSNFDIFQAAGGSFKGNIQEINAVSDRNGIITLQLVTIVDNASINGIELLAAPGSAAPAAPTNLTATVGNALVTLNWSAPAGATSFFVRRYPAGGGAISTMASNLTPAFYRDSSAVINTTYNYFVTASNAFGESPASSLVSARATNGLPDLVVTSVTWSPATPYQSNHVVFSARVLNRGSAATPPGTILGVGFNMDGLGTVSWEGTDTTSLGVNSSVTLTADGGPTGNYWVATPGPHTVIATVDDVNRITENVEDNNSLAVPMNVLLGSYAVNSGGAATGIFSADTAYAGSANTYSVTNVIDLTAASNAAPAALYQTERWGEFTYVFGSLAPGSNYTVRLHFAEISPSVSGAGDRRFNVSLNGLQVLNDWDVFAAAGAKFKALTVDIRKRADASGTLYVQFSRGYSNYPKCSGIQVFGSTPIAAPVATATSLGPQRVLTWPTLSGGLYQAQYKNDLAETNWTALTPVLLAGGASLSVTNEAVGVPKRFYRIVGYQ